MLPKSTKKAINSAIPKATRSSSLKAPKEKHVKNLIGATLTRDPAVIDEIVRGLCKRLEKANWVVVLKTLIIFHRIFREGDGAFLESLRTRSVAIFAVKRFAVSAPPGDIYTLFVQKYAKYLEENVSVLRLLGFNFERTKDCMKNLSAKESFKRVPKLQSQLNALLNCKMHQHHIGRNGLLISAYTLLLKDSLVLYPMLNVGVIGLIDQVFKMKKTGAKKVLGIYTLFVKETEALIKLYDICRTFTNRLPPIHPAKATLIDVLNSHISKLEDDDGHEDETEDGHVGAEMEDALLAASHNPASASSSKHADDSDSDTSSDSSDDEANGLGGNGNNNNFDWGFGGAVQQYNGGGGYQQPNGASVATGINQQQGQGPTTSQYDPRASVGPNSFAFLTSQPSQPATTSAQGWDIFDTSNFGNVNISSPPPSSSHQGGHQQGGHHQGGHHQGGHQQVQGGYQDPFASFSPQPVQQAPSSPPVHPHGNYQDRATATKSGLFQIYASSPPPSSPQHQHQPQQQQQENPFGSTNLATQNPFGGQPQQNPFAQTQSPLLATSPPPAAAPAPSNSSYNPFL